MIKRFWWAGAIALVLVVFLALFASWHTAAPPAANAAPPSVPLYTARRGEVTQRIDAAGRVGPTAGSDAKLSFAQSGIIAAIDVRVGENVSRGQVLAELDRRALAAGVASARADLSSANAGFGGGAVPGAALASAQAKLVAARERLAALERGGEGAQSGRIAAIAALNQAALKVQADSQALTRERTLYTGGVVALKDVQAAQSQLAADQADERAAQARVAAAGNDAQSALRAAQSDVQQAQSDVRAASAQSGLLGAQAQGAAARLDAAQIAYANGVLRSPDDGVVYAVLHKPGEAVDPTTPVIDVGPRTGHSVTLDVPAADAARIRVGDAATLSLARQGERARGRVIAVVPSVNPATQLATVVVGGVPSDAVSGDAISATIDVATIHGVVIPATAVVEDPQTGKTVVFVRGKDGFAARAVVVGGGDERVVTVTGLQPGDRVAAQGGFDLLAPS